MSLIRGILLDNLGLKLVALLLAIVIYLHVYTERPASMVVSFPVQVVDLADTLALSGTAPEAVQAKLRGTGKQLIRLRLTEPQLKISLAGIGPGRFERVLSSNDLPLVADDDLEIERLITPRVIELQIDRKANRRLAVTTRVVGVPHAGVVWPGTLTLEPSTVILSGPREEVARLDSVRLYPVPIEGRSDTFHVQVKPESLPQWCSIDPPTVTVTVPLHRARSH
jgi:YbbR domain-containing protein